MTVAHELDHQYTIQGRKDSDIRPKMQNHTISSRKNVLYMDEALAKTKFGIYNYVLIFMSGTALFSVLMETCGVSFVIPVSQCDMKMTAGEKGFLSAVAFLGIICSSHLWGFLADTKGRRCVMLPTLFIAVVLSCASSLVQNFYVFVTLRFFNGFFISGSSATIYAYLSEFHGKKERARAIMGSSIIYGISCLFLPLISWLVINQDWQFYIPYIDLTYKPWRFFMVVGSLPGLLAFSILLFLPESPKFVLGQGNKAAAYETVRKMYRVNNGKGSELETFELAEEAESIENRQRILETKDSRFPLLKSIWIQTAPLFKPPHLFSTILVCTIQFGIYATCNGFYMFFPDILNKMATNVNDPINQRMPMCEILAMKPENRTSVVQHPGSDEVCITKLELKMLQEAVALESLFAGGFIVIGLLINKVGKFPILLFLLLGSGSGGILAMLIDIPMVQVYSFIVLICCGMAVNVVNAATVELYPTSLRAMSICISLMFGRLGCVAGANTAALLLENHCEIVFYLSGSSLIAIGILTYFIPNIREKSIHEEPSITPGPRLSMISLKYRRPSTFVTN